MLPLPATKINEDIAYLSQYRVSYFRQLPALARDTNLPTTPRVIAHNPFRQRLVLALLICDTVLPVIFRNVLLVVCAPRLVVLGTRCFVSRTPFRERAELRRSLTFSRSAPLR